MTILEIFILAFALGLDAFSVALAIGTTASQPRQIFRMSWHFGLFQFFMPLLGWLSGNALLPLLGEASHWVAFAILVVIGVKMILEGRRHPEDNKTYRDRTRGWNLIFLSIATSIDAFAAGIGLGMLSVNLLQSCLIIGLVAAGMTTIGMLMGNALQYFVSSRAEQIGGVALIAIAFKMFL